MASSAYPMPFGEVLDAVDQLPLEEQKELAAIVLRRLAEQGRKQLVRDVDEARQSLPRDGADPRRRTN